MTKERLMELWQKTMSELDIVWEPKFSGLHSYFARNLLFECAKIVCMNCKKGNASEPTNNPTYRIHNLSKNYSEPCRAVAFFIEGE